MRQPWLRRFGDDEQGAVILETALMLMILLMLMFGIFDVGRVLYTSNSLTYAVREAARAGAVQTSCSGSAFSDSAKARVIARFKPFGGANVTSANVSIQPSSGCPVGGYDSVGVTYTFRWITPLPTLLRWGADSTRLHAQAIYRYEP